MKKRKLNIDDVFFLSEIIAKMNFEDEVVQIQKDAMKQDDPQSFAGIKLTMIFVKNIYKAKEQVKDWVADIRGIEVKEVEKLGFKELTDTIKELFMDDEIQSFFSSLLSEEQN